MKNNALRKFSSLILCLCIVASLVPISACNKTERGVEEVQSEPKVEQYALAIRAIDEIESGEAFTADKLETVRVRIDALPKGAYSDIESLGGKYALSHINAGDFVTGAKTTDIMPEKLPDSEDTEHDELEQIDPYELGYVIITKYASLAEGGDYAPAIKKAIEENPARTIYFPDGEYVIKSPIVIPTDPDKSVSLRLSSHAVITAADWVEDKTVAMIQIGCEQDVDPITDDTPMDELDFSKQRSICIIGGCIYGSKMASGIAIGGGKDTYIYNVSIKRTYNGIHVKRADNELGATYVNVDNVNIVGMEAKESSGVLVEGSYNTFSNMRIASTNYGVLCTETGSNNSFRFLHPLVVGLNGTYTVGFWDKSAGNSFDACYSDQFSTGYRVEEISRSVFNGCLCYWYSERNDYHVGYESSGKLNSIIVSGKVLNHFAVAMEAYLYVRAEGGQGVVLYPINSTLSDMYPEMLKAHCKTHTNVS